MPGLVLPASPPPPYPPPAPPPGASSAVLQHARHAAMAAAAAAASAGERLFQVGEQVLYFSRSTGKWVPAVVLGYNKTAASDPQSAAATWWSYRLNVQPQAPPSHVAPRDVEVAEPQQQDSPRTRSNDSSPEPLPSPVSTRLLHGNCCSSDRSNNVGDATRRSLMSMSNSPSRQRLAQQLAGNDTSVGSTASAPLPASPSNNSGFAGSAGIEVSTPKAAPVPRNPKVPPPCASPTATQKQEPFTVSRGSSHCVSSQRKPSPSQKRCSQVLSQQPRIIRPPRSPPSPVRTGSFTPQAAAAMAAAAATPSTPATAVTRTGAVSPLVPSVPHPWTPSVGGQPQSPQTPQQQQQQQQLFTRQASTNSIATLQASSPARGNPGQGMQALALLHQRGFGPEFWGISSTQLAGLASDRRHTSGMTTREVVKRMVKPDTAGTGLGYALFRNLGQPLRGSLFVSHAWDEKYAEFVTVLTSSGESGPFWVCATAMCQADRQEIIGQVRMKQPVVEVVIAAVLQQAAAVLCVLATDCNMYARLWCLYEIHEASRMKLDIRVAQRRRAWGLADEVLLAFCADPVDSRSARCGPPGSVVCDDEKVLRARIERFEGGFDDFDRVVDGVRLSALIRARDQLLGGGWNDTGIGRRYTDIIDRVCSRLGQSPHQVAPMVDRMCSRLGRSPPEVAGGKAPYSFSASESALHASTATAAASRCRAARPPQGKQETPSAAASPLRARPLSSLLTPRSPTRRHWAPRTSM